MFGVSPAAVQKWMREESFPAPLELSAVDVYDPFEVRAWHADRFPQDERGFPRLRLLQHVAAHGNVHQAAREVGVPYSTAAGWLKTITEDQ